MKITVMTADKQIIALDVDGDDAVENVKALLEVESGVALQQQQLLYNGKEMGNHEKLSSFGVGDGDLITMVPNSAPLPGSSQNNDLRVNPDGSAVNPAAFQQQILRDSNILAQNFQDDPELAQAISGNDRNKLQEILRHHHQQREELEGRQDEELQFKTGVKENEVAFGEGQVSSPLLSEKDIDEESLSGQESAGGNNDLNDEINIQSNGTANHVEEFDLNCQRVLNSSNKELSSTSIQKVGSNVIADNLLAELSKEIEIGDSELLDSKLSPSAAPLSTNTQPTTTRGRGLKKWRRIKRDIAKDASSSLDSTKMLKRGSANILDANQPNEGSVTSTNAVVMSPEPAERFSFPTQSSNHVLAVDATFSAGADDSDRSSKSSTAASVPKHKHSMVIASGSHLREKHRVKNVPGRQVNNSGQRSQFGKGHTMADTSKKPRGENIKAEKENSLSSMESDSRSYGSVLVRGTGSVNSDQLLSERSANFDGEDSYDGQTCEVQCSEEVQAVHCRNGDHLSDCSVELSCNNNEGNSKNHQLSRECEPLLNSILMLQSAQEALEREVQLFKELGRGIYSVCDDTGKSNGGATSTMFTSLEACMDATSDSRGSGFNHDILVLKRQLDNAQATLKEKEMRVVELEMAMNSIHGPQVDARNLMELQIKRDQEIEVELEAIYKQNVEAEVQYIVMRESMEDFSVVATDRIMLLQELNSKASKQAQLLRMVEHYGNETVAVQGQNHLSALEEELPKMQKRMIKFCSCLLIQLFLLALGFRLLMSQLSPKSATVVPT